tara:strand:+ start:2999 stop:3589 length:591 start_codon:yes stop_codon:yes gene_type:complete
MSKAWTRSNSVRKQLTTNGYLGNLESINTSNKSPEKKIHNFYMQSINNNNNNINNQKRKKPKSNCEDIPNDMGALWKYVEGNYITKEQYKKFENDYKNKKTAMNYNSILIKAYELAFKSYSKMNNAAMHTLINKTIHNFVVDYSAIIGQPPCPMLEKTLDPGMLGGMGWRWVIQVPGVIGSALKSKTPFQGPKGKK